MAKGLRVDLNVDNIGKKQLSLALTLTTDY